jgi:hypothetical protein
MAKKPSLAEAMQVANGRVNQNLEPTTTESPGQESFAKKILDHSRPCRNGKRVVAGYFDKAVSKQLRQLALDEDTSLQDLLREAINDLFTKRGKPPIA